MSTLCNYVHPISLWNQENISGLSKPESDCKYTMSEKHTGIHAVLQPQETPVIEGMQCFLIKACMTGCTFLLPLVIFQWKKATVWSLVFWSYAMIQIKALQYNNLTVDVFYHYLLQKRSALAVRFKAFFSPLRFYVLCVTNKLITCNLQMDLKILHFYLK